MSRRPAPLWAASVAVGLWIVLDLARQQRLGLADAGTWCGAAVSYVGLASAVAIARWPERRRTAWLVLLWVLTQTLPDAGSDWMHSRLAMTVMFLAAALQAPLYAHMALTYPAGRVCDRAERAFLVLAYAVSLMWQLVPALFADTRDCRSCRPRSTSLLFVDRLSHDTFRWTGDVYSGLFVALGLVFIALMWRRLKRSPPGARRTLLPLVAAGCFAAADLVLVRIAWLTRWDQPLAALGWVDIVAGLVLPVAIFLGLATIRRHRGPLGDLVVELRAARPDTIERSLARAVGDPSLELALWLPDEQRFVDVAGRPMTVARTAPGRAVTLVGPQAEPVAAIVHDTGLAGQSELLEAAASAALLALENARLQAELRAQLSELRASRMRIVAAGDAERRRLERDLHDGAQQRLLALGLALQLLADDHGNPELLAEAQAELQAALRELRELARGIHPAVLTDNGLPAAVGSLADRAPLPITVNVVSERQSQAVESAAYFVVCEALANVAKHAHARSGAVDIARVNGRLVVEVHDDGQGGADVGSGTGLRGLADRVGALDGQLTVSSGPRAGTTIRAEIPCASS